MQKFSNPDTNKNFAIECKNVGVYYPPSTGIFLSKKSKKGYWALKDVSFSLAQGDILGIVGKNGSGKSTILSVISRIISPDRGTVNTFNYTTLLLSINAGFSQNLSGRKNIFLIGLTLGVRKKVIDEKINDIISFAALGEFIDKPVGTYSTGMKSRLGFSTALYLEPEIFLIDETLGVGDQEFKKKSSEALKKKLSKNVTAIIASHSEETIKEHCDKAFLLDQGTGVLFGSPAEIFTEYNKSSSLSK